MKDANGNTIGGGRKQHKGTVSTKSKSDFGGYEFVSYTPNESDKTALRKTGLDPVKAMALLLATLQDGYKLSHSFDAKRNCFIASLTCNDEQSPNYKHILTGRGGDPETAIIWLAYLHVYRFEGLWTASESASWDI